MKPIYIPPLADTQRDALDTLYRTTKDPRLRTRAQMLLLSAEQKRKAPEIAELLRESEATVLRWLKRYRAAGVDGLNEAPRTGRPDVVTERYRTELLAAVRRRPRCLNLLFSLWTLQHLVEYLAEKMGLPGSPETV